jgi:uncharacterized protein
MPEPNTSVLHGRLAVRRLLIDLEAPLPRHWCAGDAFLTAFFNALSMSFPVGEQFFIDAVQTAFKLLPAARQDEFRGAVKGFVGQEATHRRIHALFNAHLERQGLVNRWGPEAARRMHEFEGIDARHALALTAANEHFTAILAHWLLGHHELFGDTEPRLKTLWLWHSAEELEHKAVAFDILHALGGSHAWRVKWMRRATLLFWSQALQQTARNLRRDGTLWNWRTFTSAARHLFGRRGLITQTFRPWRDYFRKDFHPSQHHTELHQQWLRGHAESFAVVGQ